MKSHEIEFYPVKTPWNLIKSHEIPMKSHEILLNPVKTPWNLIKSHEIPMNSRQNPIKSPFNHSGVLWFPISFMCWKRFFANSVPPFLGADSPLVWNGIVSWFNGDFMGFD